MKIVAGSFSCCSHPVLMPGGYGGRMGHTLLAHDLSGYPLAARDGLIGRVRDLYFDDRRWLVRYLVVELHHGLGHRRVLVSPVCVLTTDTGARHVTVTLTRAQIEHSPDIDADRPVSRQHEIALHEYYGIPFYWSPEDRSTRNGDPHLRSVRALHGYTVIGRDAAIGHVADFSVDVVTWSVDELIWTRRQWLSGPRHRLPVSAIARVSWVGKAVYLDVRALEQLA
jgi:PRC-barrel domain